MAEQAEKLRVAQLRRSQRSGRFGLRRATGERSSEIKVLEGRAIDLRFDP